MSEPFIQIEFNGLQLLVFCPAKPDNSCQDAVATYQGFVHGKPFLVASVADGHGSPKYKNSAKGAKFGVDTATLCLSDAARLLVEADIQDKPFNFARYLEEDFPALILRSWRALVEEEILRTSCDFSHEAEQETNPDTSIESFGSTLVAAIVVERRIGVISIGDSACYMQSGPDDAPEEICSDDSDVRARAINETDSLCGRTAKYEFRSQVIELEEVSEFLLYLCSDGTSDALEIDEMKKAIRSVFRGFEANGPDWIGRHLGPKLREWSDNGSRDDMGTIVLFQYKKESA